jgi:hypothetical protein
VKRALVLVACIVPFFFGPLACHTQPSPSPSPIIGWALTPGTGATAAWTQTLFIAKVATLATPCPTPGGAAYTQEGTAPGNATSFSDTTETPGAIICAMDQESFVQGGQTFYSAYSGVSAPFQVPALPTAPGTPSPSVTTAEVDKRPGPHAPTVAVSGMSRPGAPQLRVDRAGL